MVGKCDNLAQAASPAININSIKIKNMFKVFVTKLEYPLLVVTTPEGKDYLSSRTVASFIAVKNSIEFEGIHEFNFIATRKEAEQLITDRILSSV